MPKSRNIDGQLNIFDFLEPEDLVAKVAADENVVHLFGEEWIPLSQKPENITKYDELRILGPYKSIYGERWSICHAYFDGENVVALNVPFDIPTPEWRYWRLKEKVYPVDIRGICDDAYCPGCNASLDETKHLDCEKCPHCGLRIDWGPWHHFNDEENV